MKIPKFLQKFSKNLVSFIHLQLFISLISLPILLAWGIPFSLLTFAGNFLFAPILTFFLLLSSLIFFCQLLAIPNGIFIYFLEKLDAGWVWFMNHAAHNALIGFAQPPLWVILLIPCCALLILHHKAVNTHLKGIFCFSSLFLVIALYLKFFAYPGVMIDTIDCNGKKVPIITYHNQITLIDNGIIGRRLSAPSWLEYTLSSYLIKKGGYTHIDHFVVPYINKTIFEALISFLQKMPIKNLYIPFWQGKLPLKHWQSYKTLVQTCKQKNCTLHRLNSYKKTTITFTPDSYIELEPTNGTTKKETFSFPLFKISGTIDNQAIIY